MIEEDINDHELFNTAQTTVTYSRSNDTNRVTMIMKDPGGISELKLYLILQLEVEKLERRLGIFEPFEGKH
jgi:hypothetical protein